MTTSRTLYRTRNCDGPLSRCGTHKLGAALARDELHFLSLGWSARMSRNSRELGEGWSILSFGGAEASAY